MKHTLYLAENCHDCQLILDYLSGKEVELEVINYDRDQARHPEIPLFVFPALLNGNSIKAYGTDIIKYIEAHLLVV